MSGTADLADCAFRGNQAGVGPAVTNTVTVTVDSTTLASNTLTCDDDGLFLDWKNVSMFKFSIPRTTAGRLTCPLLSTVR